MENTKERVERLVSYIKSGESVNVRCQMSGVKIIVIKEQSELTSLVTQETLLFCSFF